MADFWTIQGEAGKSLDATVRDVSALGYSGMKCRFPSLGVDTWTFELVMKELAPTTEILPENNQQVTLYRAGVKFFKGRAKVSRAGYAVKVTVYGPGWEAENITMLGQLPDQTGQFQDRAHVPIPAGTLSSMISYLCTHAAGQGVPWQTGTVPTTWNSGAITLQNRSCMASIIEICRMVADLMQWVDYSTTPSTVNFSRRLAGLGAGTATNRTLDARDLDPDDFEINPILQQQVSQVRLGYTDRTAGGARRYNEQSSGGFALARVMWLPWSGPENDSFVLPEGGETAVVQTVPANVTMGTIEPTILGMIPEVLNSRANFNGYPRAQDIILTNGETLVFNTAADYGVAGGTANNVERHFQTPALKYLDATTRQPVSVVGKHLVITPEPPEWLAESGGFQKVIITGQLLYQSPVTLFKSPRYLYLDNMIAPAAPAWFNAFSWTAGHEDYGVAAWSGGPSGYNRASYDLWWFNFEITAYLATAAYTAGTTFRKPADFEWSAPPAGFAAGLLASQNWLPHEGTLSFTEAEPGGTRYRGCTIDVTNSLPAHATMKAMVQSEEIDIDSGRTTLRLGAPERLSFSQIPDKFRRAPADNITVR